MADQYDDMSLIKLRAIVTENLYWIKKKTDKLEKKECIALLRNKERYIRRNLICNICGESTKLEDMRVLKGRVMRKCKACHVKGGKSNPEYDDLELAELDEIEIVNVSSKIEEACNEFQKRMNREFIKFTRYLVRKNIELDSDRIGKKFFAEFPFAQHGKMIIKVPKEMDEMEIISKIQPFLIKNKLMQVTTDINEILEFQEGKVTIKEISLNEDKKKELINLLK